MARPCLASMKAVMWLHRPGPVQRYHGRDVAKRRWLQILDVAGHARAFHLEHAHGVTARQQLERPGVVEGDFLERDVLAARLAYQVPRLRQHGKVGEAEEVHLQQAKLRDRVHRVLRRQHALAIVPGRALQRHDVVQRLSRYDHARRVGAGVARQALQLHAGVDEVPYALVRLVDFAELRVGPHYFGEVDVRPEGHQPRHPGRRRHTTCPAHGPRRGCWRARRACRT